MPAAERASPRSRKTRKHSRNAGFRMRTIISSCSALYPPVATPTYSLTKRRFSIDPSRRRSIGDWSSSRRCGSRSHSFSTASSRNQAERARRISKRQAIRSSTSRPVGGMRPDKTFSTWDSSASSKPSSHAASRDSRFQAVNRSLTNITGPATRRREEISDVGLIAFLRSRIRSCDLSRQPMEHHCRTSVTSAADAPSGGARPFGAAIGFVCPSADSAAKLRRSPEYTLVRRKGNSSIPRSPPGATAERSGPDPAP